MQFKRARFLSSDLIITQGQSAVSVKKNIASLASVVCIPLIQFRGKINLLARASTALTGLFHELKNRRLCSSCVTKTTSMELHARVDKHPLQFSRHCRHGSEIFIWAQQKFMTRSTPARIIPRSFMNDHRRQQVDVQYNFENTIVCALFVGFLNATTRAPRGLKMLHESV